MTIQIKSRMLLLSLVLFMKKMIDAVDAFLFQEFHYVRMISWSSFFIPNSITVEIACQNGACLFQVFPIIVNGLPDLCYILSVRIIWIISPDCIEGKAFLIPGNGDGDDSSEFGIMISP